MKFVFDADVLSTFGKIKRVYLFKKIFGRGELLIPESVAQELKNSKSEKARGVAHSKLLTRVALKDAENTIKERLITMKSLGAGEIDCIAICKIRGYAMVSNDQKAIKVAESFDIDVINLETILFSLKEILELEEVKNIIEDIESKDRVIVVNKDKIVS